MDAAGTIHDAAVGDSGGSFVDASTDMLRAPDGGAVCGVEGSFITSWSLDPAAGFDLDGDDVSDNVLGRFVAAGPPPLGRSYESVLADAVTAGDLALGLAWLALDTLPDDDALGLWELAVTHVDDDPRAPYDLAALASSFDTASGEPSYRPADPVVASSTLTTGEARLLAPLPLPFFDAVAVVPLERARMRGRVGRNAAGVTVTDGVLGGAVRVDDLFSTLEAHVEASCACLGLTGPLFERQDDGRWDCSGGSSAGCPAGDDCGSVNDLCSILRVVLTPDIDLDGDGLRDAFSVGYRFEATGASIAGACF